MGIMNSQSTGEQDHKANNPLDSTFYQTSDNISPVVNDKLVGLLSTVLLEVELEVYQIQLTNIISPLFFVCDNKMKVFY